MLFLENAEKSCTCMEISLDIWLETAQSWLYETRHGLHRAHIYRLNSDQGRTTEENTQAFRNLLKASWIVNDVIRQHPQRPFVTTGHRQAPIASLANAINAELKGMKSSAHIPPSMDIVISEGNFEIFDNETLARFGVRSLFFTART